MPEPDHIPAIAVQPAAPIGSAQPPWWEVVADYKARHADECDWDEIAERVARAASERASQGFPEGGPAAAAAAPPESSTGVLTPGTECLIDYLKVTFPIDTTLETVCLIFGGAEGAINLPYGFQRYKHAVLLRPGVTVLHGGRPEMGVHVEVKGLGCRQLEAEGIVEDWALFVGQCLAFNGRVGRIDVAIDDRVGLLDMDTIEVAAWRGRVRDTPEKAGRHVRRDTNRDGEKTGHTVSFGSRESETFLRIYDKRLEQRGKGVDVDRHWVRAELELTGDRARAMAAELAKGELVPTVAGVLRAHMCFVEPNATDPDHRERWPVCAWWLAFLQHAEKVKLSTKCRDGIRTVEQVHTWLSKSAGPCLAALVEHQQGAIDWLIDIITTSAARMKSKHQLIARTPYFDLKRGRSPSVSAQGA